MIHWTPADGETVHLNPRNPWLLPAGRYELERLPAHERDFALRGLQLYAWRTVDTLDLQRAERATALTPIDPAQIERDRRAREFPAPRRAQLGSC